MEVTGFRRKFQGAIAIAEQAEVFRVPNPLAFDIPEGLDDLLGVIRGAIIEHNEPVRMKRLFRDRFKCLPNEFPAIENGDNSNDICLHSLQNAGSFYWKGML